jgi:dolichol-phosphate mannosyltransferase
MAVAAAEVETVGQAAFIAASSAGANLRHPPSPPAFASPLVAAVTVSASTERPTPPPAPGGGPAALAALSLGVVCPMANEGVTAVRFVDAVLDACSRFPFRSIAFFAVVDEVSRDDTRALLERHARRRSKLRVVWAPETRGVADAYVRGYREALAAGCDWILEIDGGFSHSPHDIGAFLAAMAAGSDCVFGSRFLAGGRHGAGLRRRLISRGGTLLTNLLLGTSLSDMTGGFELLSRNALEGVLARGIRSAGPFFQTEVKVHCRHLRVAEIAIGYDGGEHGLGRGAIVESFVNLGRLTRARLAGRL